MERVVEHNNYENEKNENKAREDYDLSISTKTKVIFLNTGLDINAIFWAIPIIPYWSPVNGVIKKQMKTVITQSLPRFSLTFAIILFRKTKKRTKTGT
jgi:hypothetical protein